jgi:hypothetical protein
MRILNIVAAAAIVVTGLAGAAEGDIATSDATAPVAHPVEQDIQIGATASVFGKVISLHNCSMVGMTEQHVLAKLESAPGDVEIVDMGTVGELKSDGIEPKQGQQFWIEGRVGAINSKPLVIAERVSESKIVIITRQAPLREETTKHAEAQHNQQVDAGSLPLTTDAKDPKAPKTETADAGEKVLLIAGNVIHTRHVSIEGESFQHVLAKVQTENGIVVLDLGTCSTLPANVDISDGRAIAASGVVGHLNGKPVLLAESVGNLTGIQRPNEPEVIPTGNNATANSSVLLRK